MFTAYIEWWDKHPWVALMFITCAIIVSVHGKEGKK